MKHHPDMSLKTINNLSFLLSQTGLAHGFELFACGFIFDPPKIWGSKRRATRNQRFWNMFPLPNRVFRELLFWSHNSYHMLEITKSLGKTLEKYHKPGFA